MTRSVGIARAKDMSLDATATSVWLVIRHIHVWPLVCCVTFAVFKKGSR